MDEPVYEPPIAPQIAQLLYGKRVEPIVEVENEPEPAPNEAESSFAEKEIQADPDEIDNKPKIRVHTPISVLPDVELEDLSPQTEEKAIQTGYSQG